MTKKIPTITTFALTAFLIGAWSHATLNAVGPDRGLLVSTATGIDLVQLTRNAGPLLGEQFPAF